MGYPIHPYPRPHMTTTRNTEVSLCWYSASAKAILRNNCQSYSGSVFLYGDTNFESAESAVVLDPIKIL